MSTKRDATALRASQVSKIRYGEKQESQRPVRSRSRYWPWYSLYAAQRREKEPLQDGPTGEPLADEGEGGGGAEADGIGAIGT